MNHYPVDPSVQKTNHAILRIVIYQVDSVIHLEHPAEQDHLTLLLDGALHLRTTSRGQINLLRLLGRKYAKLHIPTQPSHVHAFLEINQSQSRFYFAPKMCANQWPLRVFQNVTGISYDVIGAVYTIN